MPGMPNLSLVEGPFEELALELATYLDTLRGPSSTVVADITPLLADPVPPTTSPTPTPPNPASPSRTTDKDAVLKKLVTAGAALNTAPERELQAAYNLLIHLIAQSDDPDTYLPPLCKYLTTPPLPGGGGSAGPGLSLAILGTLFNTLDPDDETRYHILLSIVSLIQSAGGGSYDLLRPQLRHLDLWTTTWELDPSESRTLSLAIAAAAASHNPDDHYAYLLRAVRTLQDRPTSSEARDLSVRCIIAALQNERVFDFHALAALDSVQALRKSPEENDTALLDLLDLFVDQTYADYVAFNSEHTSDDFFQTHPLSPPALARKMRLLTLASLAANAGDAAATGGTLPYSRIATALSIGEDEVEMWVIDAIRVGLVEGKLSQRGCEFQVHRGTHRTVGERQWREVAGRLETWKVGLRGVLAVIKSQKEEWRREAEGGGGGAWGQARGDRKGRAVQGDGE